MRRRMIRHGIYLAAAVTITAVAIDHVSNSSGVQAQDVRTPILDPKLALITREPVAVTGLESAVRQTAAIAEGEVVDIKSEYSEEQGPWTTVILSNVRPIAGEVPPTIEIRQFGGQLPNGALMVATELPVFVLGRQYLVFLRNTDWNLSPIVGDLALRVEKTDVGEVMVNSDGQPVTNLDSSGFSFGPVLFEPFERSGAAPKIINDAVRALPMAPLDREKTTSLLQATLSAQALQVSGRFTPKPAFAFNWRRQEAVRSPLDPAPIDTGAREPELEFAPKN